MVKSAWVYLLGIAVIGAGGYFYYSHYHSETTINNLQAPPAVATPPSAAAPNVPTESESERNRKRAEGIGSITNLKPVEIPTGSGSFNR